jgi:AcrR family transcriptional regulator
MGHREDLLAGAKRCIAEKGFAHTTARDIVAASGTNLASIGYHFGSKDALLNAAVIDSFDDWDEAIDAAVQEQDGDEPADRLEGFLTGVVEAVGEHRPMVAASVQALAQSEFAADVRAGIAEAYDRARRQLPAMILQVDESEVDDRTARTLGSLGMALVNGLVLQHLVDPERAPSARDMVDALRDLRPPPAGEWCRVPNAHPERPHRRGAHPARSVPQAGRARRGRRARQSAAGSRRGAGERPRRDAQGRPAPGGGRGGGRGAPRPAGGTRVAHQSSASST